MEASGFVGSQNEQNAAEHADVPVSLSGLFPTLHVVAMSCCCDTVTEKTELKAQRPLAFIVVVLC